LLLLVGWLVKLLLALASTVVLGFMSHRDLQPRLLFSLYNFSTSRIENTASSSSSIIVVGLA
jgi:hypothetical protein